MIVHKSVSIGLDFLKGFINLWIKWENVEWKNDFARNLSWFPNVNQRTMYLGLGRAWLNQKFNHESSRVKLSQNGSNFEKVESHRVLKDRGMRSITKFKIQWNDHLSSSNPAAPKYKNSRVFDFDLVPTACMPFYWEVSHCPFTSSNIPPFAMHRIESTNIMYLSAIIIWGNNFASICR